MDRIKQAISFLPKRLYETIYSVRKEYFENMTEIRIRVNSPISVKLNGKTYFIDGNSNLSFKPNPYMPIVSDNEISEAFVRLCEYSVYSHSDDMKKGFITLSGGHRVGFCSTAVKENDSIISIKNVTSFNIRIASQHVGCSNEIFSYMKENGFGNILVAGEPSSGKTTILRDLARNLSNELFNVCVCDERSELFGDNNVFEKGFCVDILSSFPKHIAVSNAVRTMSPDYIITDEIGDVRECEAICQAINCGVRFAMSIHCPDYEQLKEKIIFRKIDELKRFDYIVFLKGKKEAGKLSRIITSSMR